MSYEFGPSGTHIYITSDGLNGQTADHLKELKAEILSGEQAPMEIVEALEEVLEHPVVGIDVIKQRRQRGRYLMGVSEHFQTGENKRVDGLMYAEGQYMRESGAFSLVAVTTWISKNRRRPIMSDQKLTDAMVSNGLTNIEDQDAVGSHGPWGAPVERTTRVVPLYPSGSERPEGYVYGHRKDFVAIEGLSLPDELKLVFADVAASWHGAELEGDAPALADSIRATLSGWELPK